MFFFYFYFSFVRPCPALALFPTHFRRFFFTCNVLKNCCASHFALGILHTHIASSLIQSVCMSVLEFNKWRTVLGYYIDTKQQTQIGTFVSVYCVFSLEDVLSTFCLCHIFSANFATDSFSFIKQLMGILSSVLR